MNQESQVSEIADLSPRATYLGILSVLGDTSPETSSLTYHSLLNCFLLLSKEIDFHPQPYPASSTSNYMAQTRGSEVGGFWVPGLDSWCLSSAVDFKFCSHPDTPRTKLVVKVDIC